MPADSKQPAKGAPKIMDVINKRSQASANSRPVISSKKPQSDPMVVGTGANANHKMATSPGADSPQADGATVTNESDQPASQAPLSVHRALRLEPIDPHKVGEVFTPNDDQKTVKSDGDTAAKPDSPEGESAPDEVESTGDEAEAKADQVSVSNDSITEELQQPKKADKPSETSDADKNKTNSNGAQPVPEATSATDDSDKKIDNVPADKPAPAKGEAAAKDSIDEQTKEEVLEPVDLLRDQEKHYHGSAVAILLGILVIIILAAVAIDLAVDASLISLNIPHTHLFSN